MLLWVIFALMTAAVMTALLRPLWSRDAGAIAPAEADLAVYRDQLNEIEADRDRGLLAPAEAESAKTEVARRILSRASGATAVHDAPVSESARSRADWVSRVAAALVPVVAIAVYLYEGSPSLPGAPLEARRNVSAEDATVAELIGKVEARLTANPNDGQGWSVIAPVYMRLGRYGDAAQAFSRANSLLGENVAYLMGFAEALVLDNDGMVIEPARKAFRRVIELEPGRAEASFALSLAKEQDGDTNGAIADYRSMLSGAPADAPWKAALEQRIKALEDKLAGRAPPTAPAPTTSEAPAKQAPNAAGIAAMAPEDQAKAIEGMVQQLADRLKTNGKDLPGWLKLIRAYSVLGRTAELETALSDARRNFDGDTAALGEIDALAKSVKQGS